MRFFSVLALCVVGLIGCHAASIREAREAEQAADAVNTVIAAAVDDAVPVADEVFPVPAVALKAAEAQTLDEVPANAAVETVLPVEEVVSELKIAEPVVVAIVEPETEVVSELKAVPIQAVEEVAEPAVAPVVAEEQVAQAVAEEAAPVIALKSVPVVAEEKEEALVAEPVVAVEEEPQVVPVVKSVAETVAIAEEQKPVEAAAPAIVPETVVEPVEGTERQNAVAAESETQRPTLLQQAQQVLTPITNFIQNNPLTSVFRGGAQTTAAPAADGSPAAEEPATSTTARPGIFAQLFNPSTNAPAAANAAAADDKPTTAAPGFIQTAFSNIQNALPQPPNIIANIQNIFSGNRNQSTAAPATTAAAPAAPAAAAEPAKEELSSNSIDQAKKKRLDEEVEAVKSIVDAVEEEAPVAVAAAAAAVQEEEVKPVALLAQERLDAIVKDEQVVTEVKTQET